MDYDFSDEEGDWDIDEDIIYEETTEKQEYLIPENCKLKVVK